MLYEEKDIILHVENLSIAYGENVIIKDINFVAKNVTRKEEVTGQIIAVVGRSGRGKSTLFRALTGLVPPTTGKILIPDYALPPTNGMQPAKIVAEGDVGFVDQKYTLFRHKTVYDAFVFALRNAKISSEEKKEKVNQYMKEW